MVTTASLVCCGLPDRTASRLMRQKMSRLFCNLIRSYLSFLLDEHER
jgi:hypothetical protein